MLLTIIYWVLWVLALVATFAPSDIWPRAYVPALIYLLLFGVIGLRSFRTSAA